MTHGRERWGTRIGLILAMAGNAIGLGNFLRFPSQAVRNGGGAFMIPYFCALVFLGLPLMWMEWSLGRLGGRLGSGTCPRIFSHLTRWRWARYLGGLGIAIPLVFVVYYTYIESWTLAYAWFSASGKYWGLLDREGMGGFLGAYQGRFFNEHFASLLPAYAFLLLTLACNLYVLEKGVVKGIEWMAKVAMPALFLFAAVLMVRVFTLGAPDPSLPERTPLLGFAYLWNPDLSRLGDSQVWLAAAGQVFFTLSVGLGTIVTYASYLREKDDVVLSGLTTASTNEFAEVILGGSIAIPVAVAYFGVQETASIADGGMFDLGFQSMPIIFQRLPLGQVFGLLWFLLLFFAGITSSVALAQTPISFLQDEFGFSRRKAVFWVGAAIFLMAQPVVLFLPFGFLDELDFWVGSFGISLFAVTEVILFAWVFGMDRCWAEIQMGAEVRPPRFFYFVIKYVTPVYLLVLLAVWSWQQGVPTLLMSGAPEENRPYLWLARAMMLAVTGAVFWMIHRAWKRRPGAGGKA